MKRNERNKRKKHNLISLTFLYLFDSTGFSILCVHIVISWNTDSLCVEVWACTMRRMSWIRKLSSGVVSRIFFLFSFIIFSFFIPKLYKYRIWKKKRVKAWVVGKNFSFLQLVADQTSEKKQQIMYLRFFYFYVVHMKWKLWDFFFLFAMQ